MQTATEIYETFKVPPWLQLHQVRVAAVGRYMALLYGKEAVLQDVISACLLHDIGAIVKFDFSKKDGVLDGLYRPEDSAYWRGVQEDMRSRYGSEEHPATAAIMKEIGISERVQDIVNSTGIRNLTKILEKNDVDIMIVQYADARVAPHGVTTLEGRLHDVKMRYADRLRTVGRFHSYDADVAPVYNIEKILFERTALQPAQITEEGVRGDFEWLWNFRII